MGGEVEKWERIAPRVDRLSVILEYAVNFRLILDISYTHCS